MLVYMVVIFSSGIDEMLSQHIAHLFIRDPISLFSEKIHQDDNEDVDHFEVREKLLYIITSCESKHIKN